MESSDASSKVYEPGFKSKFVNINWAFVKPGSVPDTCSLSIIRTSLESRIFSMVTVIRLEFLNWGTRQWFERAACGLNTTSLGGVGEQTLRG